MLPPAFITVAIAAKGFKSMIWNFAWFLLLAKVGILAFDSLYGSYPAVFLALLYTHRMLQNRSSLKVSSFNFSNFQSRPMRPKKNETVLGEGDVIEAEFHRENELPSDSPGVGYKDDLQRRN